MNKRSVTVITIALALVLLGLFYYGLKHARGAPVDIPDFERARVEVPRLDAVIDLAEGIAPELWASVPGQEIPLTYQAMVLPWPKRITPQTTVQAFHNGEDIYFKMTWEDDTMDDVLTPAVFSDACAIMFPLSDNPPPSALMMGFLIRSNIWHWKAVLDREFWAEQPREDSSFSDYHFPFEEEEILSVSKALPIAAADNLIAKRVSTVTRLEEHNIEARGVYDHDAGQWQVVLKSTLTSIHDEDGVTFLPGSLRHCAFAVFNGATGDRGGRKSISNWVELAIQ